MTISAFTHIGTKRQTQQDAILINGQLLTDSSIILENQSNASCFVADGVASSTDGSYASRYVLEEVSKMKFGNDWQLNVSSLIQINERLIRENSKNGSNSATTLCGIIYCNKNLHIYQSGDCELNLLRGKHFIPLAPVQNESVENIKKSNPSLSTEQAHEKAANTLTSYFGSQVNRLTFDLDWKRRICLPAIDGIKKGDKLIICSDGLFKSISKSELLEIVSVKSHNQNNMDAIKEKCLTNGAPDNVSLILIDRLS